MTGKLSNQHQRDEQLDVDTYITERNHRYTVDTGTLIANTCLSTRNYGFNHLKTETEARRRVILAFERRFGGSVPWNRATIQTTFLTVQVIVELRVDSV